jgi:uncharacterized protein (PEP-CTERM system associated)
MASVTNTARTTRTVVTYASDARPKNRICHAGRRYTRQVVVMACLLISAMESVQAAEWRFRPWLTVAETFSDNINISATNPEQDYVTIISPGFTLNGKGRRFSLDVFYNLQYLNYARNTDSDRFDNELQVVGNGELAEDLFFLDIRSTVSQVNITNRANTANSSISITDNVTNAYTFGISPYLKHRFGSFMDGEARYTYDKVNYSTGQSDSQANTVFLDLASGNRFETLTWNTYYRGFREDQEFGPDITFKRGEVNGRYHFNRKYALMFGTGYEDNDFFTTKTDTLTAVTWLAGLSLRPNSRTLIEGGAQNRFFGVAPFLNISYRSKRTALAIRYLEDLTTTNQVQFNRTLVPLLDAFGDPILDPNTGEAIEVPIDTPGTFNQVVVNQTFDGTVTVRGQRTDVGITLYDQYRNFQIGPDEEVYGGRAFANRRLSRHTTLNVWGRVQQSDFDGPTPDRRLWEVGIGLVRQFSRSFFGRINASHISQDSNDPGFEYDENRVTLSLTKNF